MKIVYVYDVIYPETIGGVEKRIFEIGRRLSLKGHEIHLYGMKYWEGPAVIRRDGMIIHGVCPAMDLYTEGRRSIFQAIRYTAGLIPHLLRAEADIIDCQNFPYFPVFFSFLITCLKHQHFVVTWHEFWDKYWFVYLGLFGLFGYILERSALVCTRRAISVSLLTTARMKGAGFSRDVEIIPNGIDLEQMRSVPPSPVISDVIFVGRFIPEKHAELVVESIRTIVPDYPSLKCLMVGDGPDYELIRELIQRYGLSDNIECTGFMASHQDVIALMKSSKVFVLPSEREGFGIAAIEALACGLSLVTIDHPSNAASVHILPGCGYLAEMDAVDIARGIREYLVKKPDESILHAYVTSHDWDTITAKIEGYYFRMMSSEEKRDT